MSSMSTRGRSWLRVVAIIVSLLAGVLAIPASAAAAAPQWRLVDLGLAHPGPQRLRMHTELISDPPDRTHRGRRVPAGGP